jgi:Arc/MetJ-type ribon-helix-helix transcriptional regulator
MATNPIPPGTANLSVNLEHQLISEIDSLAASSGCSRSEYIRRLLTHARDHEWAFTTPVLRAMKTLAVAEDPPAAFSLTPPSTPGKPGKAHPAAARIDPAALRRQAEAAQPANTRPAKPRRAKP